jgi:hypothetical protein
MRPILATACSDEAALETLEQANMAVRCAAAVDQKTPPRKKRSGDSRKRKGSGIVHFTADQQASHERASHVVARPSAASLRGRSTIAFSG